MQAQRQRHSVQLWYAQLVRHPTIRSWWYRIRDWTERALEKVADGG